jgi:hypothetical protein
MKNSLFISGIASAALVMSLAMAEAQTKVGEVNGAPGPAAGPAGEPGHGGPQGGVRAPAGAKEAPPVRAAAEPNASGANTPKDQTQSLGAGERTGQNERKENDAAPKVQKNMRAADQTNDQKGIVRDGANERSGAGEASGRSVARQGASITPEVRTKVRSEISQAQIRQAPKLDIDVRVGGVAPRTITEYWEPVPEDIVTIVPEWSAYRVVRVGDEILIIDPVSFEIVDVLS